MKIIKWKILVLTCLVCLVSILPGVIMWEKLPESVPIHFDINNNPDNFASRGFAVFGLPCLMVLLQIICCIINDVNAHKHGESKKFEGVAKWTIPIIAVVLQIATVLFSIGVEVDIRRVAVALVSIEFLFLGNYLPKLDYVKNYKVESSKARKINRFCGFVMVILGVLGLVSLLLPEEASIVWLILLIPCIIAAALYSVILIKRKQ